MALEPVEPLIAAMSAKARLIPGRLLPAADLITAIGAFHTDESFPTAAVAAGGPVDEDRRLFQASVSGGLRLHLGAVRILPPPD